MLKKHLVPMMLDLSDLTSKVQNVPSGPRPALTHSSFHDVTIFQIYLMYPFNPQAVTLIADIP